MTKKTTKKPVKKAAPKAAAKAAPKASVAVTCTCAVPCTQRKGGWAKRLFWLIVAFALGFAACFFCPVAQQHRAGGMMRHNFDDNGCLIVEKIRCPERVQRLMAADLNRDGCITRAELKAWRKEHRGEDCPHAEKKGRKFRK
ncbi:MAG: hypothetical protein FWE17_01595 [Alphaproteobacteria bacterium]|nr:hypothetical protein [Alphaproteobacteria bacterium]MCL2758134.1 hypothetical protein [Alphaproteobacteria bacterium]